MTKPFALYTATWVAACLVAGYLMARHHATLELFHARYRRFLLQDWKVLSFVVASTGLTLVAPYADDTTWNYVDALVMCALTFATAPWAVGTLYRALKRRTAWVNGYVAVCIWLFSASWFYDLYIVLRDGAYSPYWLPNLFLSSLLYLTAGLLWSQGLRGTLRALRVSVVRSCISRLSLERCPPPGARSSNRSASTAPSSAPGRCTTGPPPRCRRW